MELFTAVNVFLVLGGGLILAYLMDQVRSEARELRLEVRELREERTDTG